MKTTLNRIKAESPCPDGWKLLLKNLCKTHADDEPLSLMTILESNGIDDAIWALRCVDGFDREIRLFACDCAESVLHLFESACPGDLRPRNAIEVSRRYADGLATLDKLDAAWAAAGDAAGAARDAGDAGDAAWAAWDARDAAWDAARAAGAAEKQKQTQLFISMCEKGGTR